MTEVQWTDRFIAAAAFAAVLSFGGMYVWAQGGNGGDGCTGCNADGSINASHGSILDGSSDPFGAHNGGSIGATDSHGQVNGGGTGSVNGGLTAGGPR